MGTDSVKLFNKTLGDQILVMERGTLTTFLEENIGVLQQKPSALSLIPFEMEQNLGSVSDSVETLLSGEQTFTLLRSEHVHQMIESLHEHADDLRVMSTSAIETLERWRDLCAADPGYISITDISVSTAATEHSYYSVFLTVAGRFNMELSR